MKNNVGLLGGTFNPIHRGHVELGLQVKEAFNLDRVLYILSARPPHKKNMPVVPGDIRWDMLTRALAPHPGLEPCDIEMKRPQDSWTVDTVTALKESMPHTRFFFISGSEGFLKIKTWKKYRELLGMLAFIVVLRKEEDRARVSHLAREEGIPLGAGGNHDAPPPVIYIYSYESDRLGISSTLIRGKRKQGRPVDDFVDKEVKKIMQEYRLYERR